MAECLPVTETSRALQALGPPIDVKTPDSSSVSSIPFTDSPPSTSISTESQHSHAKARASGSPRFKWLASTKTSRPTPQNLCASPDKSKRLAPEKSASQTSALRDIHRLKADLSRYKGKHGTAQANVLRVTLLSFLRTNSSSNALSLDAAQLVQATEVFENWWSALLGAFSSPVVSGSDRNAYLEAISGLMARPEWSFSSPRYRALLKRTLGPILTKYAAPPHLPIALGALMGKTLAYAYFALPGLAAYILKLLIERSAKNPSETAAGSASQRLLSRVDRVPQPLADQERYPHHLRFLVGGKDVPQSAVCPDWLLTIVSSGWTRHWTADSVVFIAFAKHYFRILAQLYLPDPRDSSLEVSIWSAPGLIIILSIIVSRLDAVVAGHGRLPDQQQHQPMGSLAASVEDLAPAAAAAMVAKALPVPPPRVDQLRILALLREVLHFDNFCVAYHQVFAGIFDKTVQAVALGTRGYDTDNCVALCDLTEEWLSSLIQVRNSRAPPSNAVGVVGWPFWHQVVQRILRTNNCHLEVRALSFLFNVWPSVPRSELRVITQWLLSDDIWQLLFYHWSPLVRSYYHRILCYRVASIGIAHTGWYSDAVSGKFYLESRALLMTKLNESYHECCRLESLARQRPDTAPSLPLSRCQIEIAGNAAARNATGREGHALQRTYLFDVFDNAAYLISSTPSEPTREQFALSSPVGRSTPTSPRKVPSISSLRSMKSTMTVQTTASSSSVGSSASCATPSVLAASSTSSLAVAEKIHSTPSVRVTPSDKANVMIQLKRKLMLLCLRLVPSHSNGSVTESSDSLPNISEKHTPASRYLSSPSGGAGMNTSPRHRKGRNNHYRVPLPTELVKRRPEIVRPRYRFLLVPLRPPSLLAKAGPSHILRPRLPGSVHALQEAWAVAPASTSTSSLTGSSSSSSATSCDASKKLAAYNYGARSISEYTRMTAVFEKFAEQQRLRLGGSIEALEREVPFLVAEVPWRALS